MKKTLEERFWKKIEFIPFHPCWEWVAKLDSKGYGRFWVRPKWKFAHHITLLLHNRETPASGMAVDHICRNRRCVNPEHLRVVSLKVNAIENSIGICAINAKKTHCSRGHPLFGDNMFHSGTTKRQRYCRICQRMRTERTRLRNKEIKDQLL